MVLTDHNEVVLDVLERNAALNPSPHGEPYTPVQLNATCVVNSSLMSLYTGSGHIQRHE